MQFSTLFAIVATAVSATAQTLTGQYDCTTAGDYELCNNLWGENAGSGSQTTALISANGNSVSWRTQWNWQNGWNNVKSYANVAHNTAKGVQLYGLQSAPTSWQWEYEWENSVRADVSYDIWTGWAANGAPASSASSYEIMIWLSSQGGVQPIGSPVAWGLWLGGQEWTLWKGPNANWEVFSFVSANGDVTNFNADLKDFFRTYISLHSVAHDTDRSLAEYLQNNQGVSQWQYIQLIQTGTEPFTGSASLLTENFSVALNH
ncbi:endocellulase [Trametes elegans]|nr:endocellulase [Trametes elegans]